MGRLDLKIKLLKFLRSPFSTLGKVNYRRKADGDLLFRKIWQDIDAVNGWMPKYESYLLYRLASVVSPLGSVVEIGSYEGKSTVALASGAGLGVSVHAIDPHTGDVSEVESGLLIDTFPKFLINTRNFENIHPIRKISIAATGDIGNDPIELLFIDGWHSEKAVNEDISSYVPLCAKEFTVVLDDWNDPKVSAGVLKNLNILPPFVGAIGKLLIFSNSKIFTRSLLGKVVKIATSRKLKLVYSK
jgi:hypothetical protein